MPPTASPSTGTRSRPPRRAAAVGALAFACGLAASLARPEAAASAASAAVEVLDVAGRPVADAAVWLEPLDGRVPAAPPRPATIVQSDKRFLPGMTVVQAGASVSFPNEDTVRHHVYSFSPAKPFELKLYIGTPAAPVVFDKPGTVVLGCNIHDQMVGWILVVDTPYYARTPTAPGWAQIGNVPPGTYTLRTWHTRLPVGAPAQGQALTVPATGDAVASVRLVGLQP